MYREKTSGRNLVVALLLCVVIAVSLVVWSWMYTSALERESSSNAVHVEVEGVELDATVIQLASVDTQTQTKVFGSTAMLVVFSEGETPLLKLPDDPVDVVWLSGTYEVMLVEEGLTYDKSEGHEVFARPEGAVFALITKTGVLPLGTIEKGDDVMVADENNLL